MVASIHASETSPPANDLRWGGRVNWDFGRFQDDERGLPNPNGAEWRRLWLTASGHVHGLEYKFDGDFSDQHEPHAKDAYLAKRFGHSRLSIGQFKQLLSLDDSTSSNYGTFLERSYLAMLAPLYRLGASWASAPGAYTWRINAYSLQSIDAPQEQGHAMGGRATLAPYRHDGRVLHLGLSLAHEHHRHPGTGGSPALSFRPREAGHLSSRSRPTLVKFDSGRDVAVDKWVLEYGQVLGALSWQAELGGARYDDGVQHGLLWPGYVYASWFPTGENRPYDSRGGRFGRVKPRHRWGALELAARYEWVTGHQNACGQPPLRDGKVSTWTFGVNWYLRGNLRLMLNYIDATYRDALTQQLADRTQAITGRFHYDF